MSGQARPHVLAYLLFSYLTFVKQRGRANRRKK